MYKISHTQSIANKNAKLQDCKCISTQPKQEDDKDNIMLYTYITSAPRSVGVVYKIRTTYVLCQQT